MGILEILSGGHLVMSGHIFDCHDFVVVVVVLLASSG